MRSNLSRWPTGKALRSEWKMKPLAERFREAGWRTAAVATNPLLTTIAQPAYQDFEDGFDSWNGMSRRDDWNTLRARISGNPPNIKVWMNGTLVTDWTGEDVVHDDRGKIGFQMHGSKRRWAAPDGYHAIRKIGVRELP